jgi:mycofactocin system creatininase family protein
VRLASHPWPTVAAWAKTAIIAVPVGSTEQHGPHLPLSTDTDIAVALAERLAAARHHVVVAPPIAYGSSGEHAGFAGTLSIGQAALEHLLVELVRSADAFRGVVLVNAHGGNASSVARAVARLATEGRRVVAWAPTTDGDLHAGRSETSLMLALAPDLVRMDAAEAGDRRPFADLIGALHADGVAAVSPNGVLGDPAGASRDEGAWLLHSLSAALIAAVDDGFPA